MISLTSSPFIEQYKAERPLLIDTRSEGEFGKGHIPGAVNIPLLNNEHRAIVGTLYKQKGRQEAVLKGLELAGPLFHDMALKVKELSKTNKVMVYCWRGGMRSNIFCWLMGLAGYQATLLKGGYKAYRNWALNQFSLQRNIIILGGKTGSGKTEMLEHLRQSGSEQVICLEGLAHHKGSAFGALGQEPQPTQEHFENILAFELHDQEPSKPLWLENESRNVGSIKIPDPLFDQMRTAAVVSMNVDKEVRLRRLMNEYGNFDAEVLAATTQKLQKRMGGQHVKAAVDFLMEGNKEGWLQLLLDYYDRTYAHSNDQRDQSDTLSVDISWNDKILDINNLISASKQLN